MKSWSLKISLNSSEISLSTYPTVPAPISTISANSSRPTSKASSMHASFIIGSDFTATVISTSYSLIFLRSNLSNTISPVLSTRYKTLLCFIKDSSKGPTSFIVNSFLSALFISESTSVSILKAPKSKIFPIMAILTWFSRLSFSLRISSTTGIYFKAILFPSAFS